MKRSLPYAVAVLSITASLLSRGFEPVSIAQPRTPVLIELFTSEGCSSCPPADKFLEKLDRQPVPGAILIVLSEHVDYWDDIGWKDPYSSHVYSERQGVYASRLGLHRIYTPQMVVDGATELVGSSSALAYDAISRALSTPKVAVRTSSTFLPADRTLTVRVEADTLPSSLGRLNAEVYVALALNHAASHVSRGENGGRTLSHVAVARHLVRVGLLNRGERFSKDVSLKLDSGLDTHNLRVIAFVQEPKQGKVLGAVEQLVEQ